MAQWARESRYSSHGNSTYEEYFFKNGGNVELALAFVFDKASHMQADGEFGDIDAPATRSAAAAAAAGVAPAASAASGIYASNMAAAVPAASAAAAAAAGGGGGYDYFEMFARPQGMAQGGQAPVNGGSIMGLGGLGRLPGQPAVACANDSNFDGVCEAVLGAQNYLTRRLMGCTRCGWFRPIDDYSSTVF
jgi:hypothetical protein